MPKRWRLADAGEHLSHYDTMWCHNGVVDISRHVQNLQQHLLASAELGGEEAKHIAQRLAASLDSSLRLMVLELLSEAGSKITSEIAPASVDIRMRGQEPEIVVNSVVSSDVTFPDPSSASTESLPEGNGDYVVDGKTTRTTLRLPENLKGQAETAAAEQGISVNTWLVRAVATAIAQQGRTPQPVRRHNSKVTTVNNSTQFTGWVR